MNAPVIQLDPVQSALIVEGALHSAPYNGQDPVINDRDGHVDALASVASVLAQRNLAWYGFRASWSIHGLSELQYHHEHEPAHDPDDPAVHTAVLSLDVPHYQEDASLRSIVSSAAHELRGQLDSEGIYLCDVIIVVTHRKP